MRKGFARLHAARPMRAALLLTLALLTPLGAAVPASDDVAWLAAQLGVAPGDLPATVPGREGTLGPGGVAERAVAVPIAEVAAQVRQASVDEAAEETLFAGLGIRGVTGNGVRWSASGGGPAANVPCMQVSVVHDVGETPLGHGYLGMHSAVPDGASLALSGVATMDVALIPPAATAVPTMAVDAQLLAGTYRTTCTLFFGLILTTATIAGDGVLSRAEP